MIRIIILQLFLFALTIAGCNSKINDAIIKGRIIGKIPEKINYSAPVNGNYFWGFSDQVAPDSLGHFQITASLNKPGFLQIYFGDQPILIIEPGGKYEVTFISEENENEYISEIQGTLSEIQVFYNTLSKENPRTCVFMDGKDFSEYKDISNTFIQTLSKEITSINEFYKNGKISRELYETMKMDRHVYYSAARSVLASINNVSYISKNERTPEEIISLWGDAVSHEIISKPYFQGSVFSFDYLEQYFWYKVFTTIYSEEFKKVREVHRNNGTIHTHTLQLAKDFFQDEVLEFYSASYIYFHAYQRRNEKEFLSIMEEFTKTYPNSHYLKYLEPIIKENKKNAIFSP